MTELIKVDVQGLKARINLIEVAGRYTQLKRVNNRESKGPCPFCGGDDRFRVFVDHFFCRPGDGHCGAKGDAIDFIVKAERLDFLSACQFLDNGIVTMGAPTAPVPHAGPSTAYEFDAEKQAAALKESHEKLIDSNAQFATQCRDYLLGRGLTLDTIKAFGLGYKSVGLPGTEGKNKQLAVAMPWYDPAGVLVSIKYRFLITHEYKDSEDKDRAENKTSRGASKGHCFGWQALRRRPWLVVVEGELNAMSIWQAAPGVDVLSVGSMYMMEHLPDELIAVIPEYDRVIVWADELEFAQKAAGRLGEMVIAMSSKEDANELLQAGKLAGVIEAKLTEETPAPKTYRSTRPYAIQNGEIVFQREKQTKEGIEITDVPVCAFTAQITNEIVLENGKRMFRIEGVGKRGGAFVLEIDAETFGNNRQLCAALEAAVGSKDTIYADQHKHMGAAIKILTEDITPLKRYLRTGWTDHGYMLPGKTVPGVDVQLPRKLAFAFDQGADLALGLAAVRNLIEALDRGNACINLATMLGAPAAHLAEWDNERYALFNRGRTNSLKTTWTQTALCIYGAGFISDNNLIRMGEGSTRTALLSYATSAQDMPMLIDNYKPNTGGGHKDFYGFLHAVLEGGDKDRGQKDGVLRENRPIGCWPIFTGEDMPDSDASSFARVLVITFAWPENKVNETLAAAQRQAEQLPAVGREWLHWLESGYAQKFIDQAAAQLNAKREQWIEYLSSQNKGAKVTLRIATSLAINELSFWLACQHPTIGPILLPYKAEHIEGLRTVASSMATSTTESVEYKRYLGAVRELLITKKALVMERGANVLPLDPDGKMTTLDPERFIGWHDSEGYYLLPNVTRKLVLDVLGKDGLNSMSNQALYNQMKEAGLLIPGADASTKLKNIDGERVRVIHLRPNALQEDEEQNEPDAATLAGI